MSFRLFHNIDVGTFTVTGITPSKGVGVMIWFGFDINGIPGIYSAQEKSTGKYLTSKLKILV